MCKKKQSEHRDGEQVPLLFILLHICIYHIYRLFMYTTCNVLFCLVLVSLFSAELNIISEHKTYMDMNILGTATHVGIL